MTEDTFRVLLERYIVPQFPTTTIETNSQYGVPTSEAVQPPGPGPQLLVVRPTEEQHTLALRRSQGFNESERNYIKYFIQEACQYDANGFDFHAHVILLQNTAVAKTVALSFAKTLQRVLGYFEILRERTYEGSSVAFAVTVDPSLTDGEPKFNLEHHQDQDFLIVLSNGIGSVLELDSNGNVIRYSEIPSAGSGRDDLFAPAAFRDFCALCDGDKVGLVLTVNGDILIFKKKELVFARRRGTWKFLSHEKIVQQIGNHWNSALRKQAYLTALDVSFMHTGGLIFLSLRDHNAKISTYTFAVDLFSSPPATKSKKAAMMEHLIAGKKFQELDRTLRKEICSIDGAVLLRNDGAISSIGAIVTETEQSLEGSRSAAAIGLSKTGFSIKISTDGVIKGYFEATAEEGFKPKFIVG